MMTRKPMLLMGMAAVLLWAAKAPAVIRITTNMPGGADAELREEAPDTNRGSSNELASRVSGTVENPTQNSLIYLKFGVAGITPSDLLGDIIVQTTYRNNNITSGRIQDVLGGPNTGWDYYVMDPWLTGADWGEATITPRNAPAYYLDGNYFTKGCGTPEEPMDGLTYLGRKLYDSADLVGSPLHLPVGGPFNFVCQPGSALHDAVAAALETDHKTVTLVMAIAHDQSTTNSQWKGFNYLFNPKEMLTLNIDTASPWSGMSNANGEFSPALIFVPEPTTMVILLAGGLLLRRRQ